MSIQLQSSGQLSLQLKSLRKAHKLTQAQLGARIGVKQTRIADIEKDPGAISVDQLLQLLHALDARLVLAPPTTTEAKAVKRAAAAPAGDW